jgi:hypothetical protein
MASVTHVISKIKQPLDGYLNPKVMECIQLESKEELLDTSLENISPSLVGETVDYMTRFMLNHNRNSSFEISRLGARLIGFEDYFQGLLEEIKGLDDKSIYKAVKCASFDTVFRAGIMAYIDVETINADAATINNIRIMIKRSLEFFNIYGPITADGFTFEGAYTKTINSGDGDFLTADTLWDFKVSKNEPTSKHTLQLLVYYIMGKRTGKRKFKNISKVGIFNPRLNKVYLYDVTQIPEEIIRDIETNVIGY